MPGNKKPKKQYRQKYFSCNPLAILADHSTEVLNEKQLQTLGIMMHGSLESIEKGRGTEVDVINMAIMSNVALVFAEAGLGTEFTEEVKTAQRHIVGLQARVKAIENIALTGPGILALRRLLELYDAQTADPQYNQGNWRAAMNLITKRMAAGDVHIPEEFNAST